MGSLEQLALFPGAEEGEEKAPGIARVLLLLNCLYFIHNTVIRWMKLDTWDTCIH